MEFKATCSCKDEVVSADRQKIDAFKAAHRAKGHKVVESGGVRRGR